jgi:pimeloyl-ACP methyl ester carboxylesterase
LTQFYETPEPLPPGKPGALIRFEQAYDYHLSYEATKYRILYHSVSPQGKDVAATGVVLVPDGRPPKGGWPIIAWAHDFTGSARQCAPSLLKNLSEGPLISMYASIGYAVVATDYSGLGTKFPYAALDTRSNALDVLYSIPAARTALPELGANWVVAGYSQGANVAIGVTEAVGETGATGYLGAIGVAGVAEPEEMFEHFAGGPEYSLVVSLAGGIQAVFPEFRVEEMLTEKGLRLYKSMAADCGVRSDSPTAEDLFRVSWKDDANVKKFFTRNIIANRPVAPPLLVIGGEADPVVPSALTARAVSRLCKQQSGILFVKYPGSNASEVLSNSLSEQISWIRARFSGLPAPGNCP